MRSLKNGRSFNKFTRSVSYKKLKENKVEEINKLREVVQQNKFRSQLQSGSIVLFDSFSFIESCDLHPSYFERFGREITREQAEELQDEARDAMSDVGMTPEQARIYLDVALTTMALHTGMS